MSGIYEDKPEAGAARAEIRLAGTDSAVSACRSLPLLKDNRTAPAFEADIVTTWRDFPGQAAGDPSGITLEIRRENGTLTQTIAGKVPDGAPLDISYELGGDNKSGLPRLRTNLQLDGSGEGALARSRLRLRTELNRRAVPVRWRDSALTVTMELGRVFAWPEDGRFLSQRIGQVSIQLDDGKIEDLQDYAAELAAVSGLGPALANPEGIGRALLREDLGDPMKAPRYDLEEDALALDVLDRALESAIRQVIGNRFAVAHGRAEGVKQMRVGLRRLRSILRVFRNKWWDERLDKIVPEAKRYGQILGECRDLDVFTTETLPAILNADLPGEEERAALTILAEEAENARQAARRKVVALAMEDGAFARFCVELQSLLDEAPWRAAPGLGKAAHIFASRALDKALARVGRTGDTLAAAPAHARHPLRVELKKLRYALHAFRPLYEKEVRKPYLSSLSVLQDEFGVLNDAVVARDVVLSVAGGDINPDNVKSVEAGAGYVIGWTQRGLSGQADAVLDAWRAFEQQEPFWRKES